MNHNTLKTQMHALMDQSGASEFSCFYALTNLDRNVCFFGSIGSCGDATAEVKNSDMTKVTYTLPDEEAAKRLMLTYAHISIMADLAASRLCKQFGWSQDKYEEILEDCAHRLSQTSRD